MIPFFLYHYEWFKHFIFYMFQEIHDNSSLTYKTLGSRMEEPFIMLRTRATSDVADGIKVDGASSIIHSVTGEWNTSNVDEVKQRVTTYCTDSIKQERDSPDIDNIRESFPFDRNDIKEKDTYDYVNDVKEEVNLGIIRGECPFDDIDIKEEGVSQNVQDVGEHCTFHKINIKEEEVSQNMDDIGEDRSYDNSGIKEEDTRVYMDDMEETISYNSCGTERQERDRASGGSKAKGVETTGNLSLEVISLKHGKTLVEGIFLPWIT